MVVSFGRSHQCQRIKVGQQIQIDVKQCQFLEIKTAASTINCQKQRNDAMLFIPGKTIEHINQTIDLIFNVDGRSSPTQGFVNIWQNHEHGPSLSQTNTDTKKLALTDTQTHRHTNTQTHRHTYSGLCCSLFFSEQVVSHCSLAQVAALAESTHSV